MSIKGEIIKLSVAYTYNKYYLSLNNKEILPLVTTWMTLEGIMLCEINQSQNNKCYIIVSYEVYKIIKLLETKNRIVVSRG